MGNVMSSYLDKIAHCVAVLPFVALCEKEKKTDFRKKTKNYARIENEAASRMTLYAK